MEQITPIYNPERAEHDDKTAGNVIVLLTPTPLDEASNRR
jgi:hypothetical protein